MNNQTFSQSVKEEICRLPMGKSCCMLSELCALTQTSGQLAFRGRGRVQVTFGVESPSIAKRIFILLKHRLNITPRLHYVEHARFGGKRECVLTLGDTDSQALLTSLKMMEMNDDGSFTLTHTTPRYPITRQCCRRAFIRGMFLGCGTISNPESSYHAEWVTDSDKLCDTMVRLLLKSDLPCHVTKRSGKDIIYISAGDQISTLLAAIGAGKSMMALENIRITHEAKLNANRARNCDEANGEKTINAAVRQIQAIRKISETSGIDSLSEQLRQLAQVRMENPEMSLAEIGEMLTPPLGKSGVNHRMRKIMEIAGMLPENGNDEK